METYLSLFQATSFGQVPELEHNGKKANQSLAITRYVAKQAKLTEKDDWEDLEIHTANDPKQSGFIEFSCF